MSLANFFSSGGSESKTVGKTAAQTQAIDQAVKLYQSQLGQGQDSYTGQRVASLSPGQLEATNLTGWSQYLQPYQSTATYGQAGQALGDILTGEAGASPISQNQIDTLFQAAYEQPTMRNWENYLKPEIREAYSGPGFWSTARMGAQQEGAQGVSDFLAEQYGNLNWQAQQENRQIEEAKANRALSAISPALAYDQAPTQNTLAALSGRGAMYDLASVEQQQRQAEINASIQKFAEQNRLTDPEDLQALMALLDVGLGYSSSDTYPPGAGLTMLGSLGKTPGGSASVSTS